MKLRNHKTVVITAAIGVIYAAGFDFAYNEYVNKPLPALQAYIPVKVATPEKPAETVTVEKVTEATTTEVASTPAPEDPSTAPEEPAINNPYPENSSLGYVFAKRLAVDKPLGVWGTAISWAKFAYEAGYDVDFEPRVNDVAIADDIAYFVESVDEKSFTVSTYRNKQVTETVQFNTNRVTQFLFIH